MVKLLYKNRFSAGILGALTVLMAALFFIGPGVKEQKPLIVYDVHADSPRIVKDDGSIEFADYVRIKNVTPASFDLTGLFLSDSTKKYDKLPLDGIVIAPGDSVMIRLDPSWNFALKRTGDESVYLSDSKGNVLFKYSPDMKPEAPVLSADSGFYKEEFSLTMSVKGNYHIYYTLDGCEPGPDSPEYTGPIRVYDRSDEPNTVVNIPNLNRNYLETEVYDEETGVTVNIDQPNEEPVDKAFIIRAVAMDELGNKSDVITREYFFCGSKYSQIISVVADRNDLFGPYGIASTGAEYDEWYQNGQEGDEPSVNFRKKGREWEVPADMDYFSEGTRVFTQKCGIRLQGRTTRNRRIKNFQLRARNCYSGSDVFEYDFFDNEEFRSDAVVLDDSFRESVFLSLIEDEDIIKQKTTGATALFINGELWNIVFIRQRIDEKYFADHYGIEPENLFVLSESYPQIGIDTDEELEKYRGYYLELDSFIGENDLSEPENYDKLCTMMDMDSYISYIAINTWVGCNDWGEYENDQYWRVKEPYDNGYGDGRFRWMIHDGDNVFNKEVHLFDERFLDMGDLFPGLMKNPEFRHKLADRLKELGQTSFSKKNTDKVLSSDKWIWMNRKDLEKIARFREGRVAVMDDVIEELE